MKTLLLGLGNELYRYDGIATQVVRRFKERGGQGERLRPAIVRKVNNVLRSR